MNRPHKHTLIFNGLFFVILFLLPWPEQIQTSPQKDEPSIGNTSTLVSAYDRWKAQKKSQGNEYSVSLPLTYVKGLSSDFSSAKGRAKLDLIGGVIDIKVSGLSKNDTFDVWLVDKQNHNEYSLQKTKIYIGQLAQNESSAELRVTLDANELSGFELNRIVVTYAGQAPEKGGLLFGSPILFQRLFYNERRLMAAVQPATPLNSDNLELPSNFLAPFTFLLPAPAIAEENTAEVDLAALVAQGEDLFFNETFNGNGRTCGTCHRAENNFTIDPTFIATLPENDPLFVAEFNEDLTELEDSFMLRQFGLIRANVDGFEDPANKFVLRSVQHMLGMSLSIQSVATEPPLQMTGWSGDGAPGGGTLRDFATGAVTQHFTQTLNRVVVEDFRLPTDAELDAIEAFTLSLGRQNELNLLTLQLTDRNAERGRVLFTTEDSQNRTIASAKCTICHKDAGALTVAGVNQNFETGIDNMPHPAALIGQSLPADDGFGTQLNTSTGGFGDGSFNTTSLVEAADTAPFFHHNGAETLEDAIAFYDSPEFRNSIEGQRLMLQDSGGQELSVDVDTLAAFLRVINALDNIRAVTDFLGRAKLGATVADSQVLLNLAQADIDDAMQVLNQSELHEEDAVPLLEQVYLLVDLAVNAVDTTERDNFIDQAIADAQDAKELMVVDSGSDITNPTVSILAPTSGSVVAGQVIISADASDDTGIDHVEFTIDSTNLGQAVASPFGQALDTTAFADGSHQVTVTAVDFSGNTQAVTITFTIDNTPAPDTTKPTVTILSPVVGSTVSGTVTISANAFDDTGIKKVIFKIGKQKLGQDLTAPFQQTWDSTAFADSLQTIKVIAVDLANNRKSAKVVVTVNNAPVVCTVYSCPNPPPPPTEPPPPPTIPDGSSPDGEFEGEVLSKDVDASTLTVTTVEGSVTLKITSLTEFNGNIALDFHSILVGHIVQGEFFTSVGEALWIETDLPPGL